MARAVVAGFPPDVTYSGSPATAPLDELRYAIGDTARPYGLTDDELEYELQRTDQDPAAAALPALQALVRKLAGRPNARVGDISVDFATRYKQASERLTAMQSMETPTILMRGRRPPNQDPYFRLGERP